MNKENNNPEDAGLTSLLRESRVSPSLPPRFQENVWRRIGKAEIPVTSVPGLSWLDSVAALVLRPRFAYSMVVALVLAGTLLGAHQGAQLAKLDAQARYVAMVAPNALR
jgi:hypothetical protein